MTNRLSEESSPYLQQHADNPVEWYPWGPEALDRAGVENKPILLSVGYSACHWCHVMAHESFENPEVAAKMNRSFINVKVDREERPDIDALYMEAVHAMTGHGGWPMTVFMTPNGEPFFAGTYFPPTARHGMPGFGELLDAIAQTWTLDEVSLTERATEVAAALQRNAEMAPETDLPDRRSVIEGSKSLIGRHDPINGGFGTAPKFPTPLALDVLFRHHIVTGDPEPLQVAELALDHMAAGGIYDHLGGGFARYSVDEAWTVPHFEKMLYDNALLLPAYLHGWLLTGSNRHLQVVTETVQYVIRDLRLEGGGFASAEDADSDGEEGLFYVWTEAELSRILDRDELTLVRDWYGVTAAGNFEGATVLHRPEVGRLARPDHVEAVRAKLFAARANRVRPDLDDKVLTEWNALMIASLAEAGAATGEESWVSAAVAAMEFLERELIDERGRWFRSWQKTGGARHLAFAADYAALIDAFTRLGEATGQARWHISALRTADALVELFWDEKSGGVFTTGSDGEQLLVRRKELYDSPTASANANAAFALRRVSTIHGRADLTQRAEEILRLVGSVIGSQPQAHSRLVAALDLVAGPMSEVVIAGDRSDLLAEVRSRYLPRTVVVHGEAFSSPLWDDRTENQAYLCQNYTCSLPTGEADILARQLDELRVSPDPEAGRSNPTP